MALYSYLTRAQCRQQLANRLYDPTQQFWSQAELNLLIAESLRTWNAITAFWRGDFIFPTVLGTQWYDLTDIINLPNTLRPFTLTVNDICKDIQFALLEPAVGLPWIGVSTQFTQADLTNAITRRIDEILSSTGCFTTRRLVPAVAGRIQLPDTVIDVRRMAYIPTPPELETLVTYTLVATQQGSMMNYALTSNSPIFPLTSSFSIPVNPVPDDVDFGIGFQINHPTALLINGVPSSDFLAFFNTTGSDGGFGAFISSVDVDYQLSGSQIYSGSESAPMMQAGTFVLSQSILLPNSQFGISTMWPEDSWGEQSFQSRYLQQPAGTPSTYLISTEPPLNFDVDRPPFAAGSYELLTVESGGGAYGMGAYGAGPYSGGLVIPDDWVHVIKWGALADLLNRDSNSRDPVRAKYCEQRYQMELMLLGKAPALLQLRLGNVPLQIDSVRSGDEYRASWEGEAPGTPNVAFHSGLNLLALAPAPDGGTYSLTATVVTNAPVPSVDSDPVQLARENLEAVLDYAQHIATFKSGGQEFLSTISLLERFMKVAELYNSKLSETGEYTSIIYSLSQLQEEFAPRMTPATAAGEDR